MFDVENFVSGTWIELGLPCNKHFSKNEMGSVGTGSCQEKLMNERKVKYQPATQFIPTANLGHHFLASICIGEIAAGLESCGIQREYIVLL